MFGEEALGGVVERGCSREAQLRADTHAAAVELLHGWLEEGPHEAVRIEVSGRLTPFF